MTDSMAAVVDGWFADRRNLDDQIKRLEADRAELNERILATLEGLQLATGKDHLDLPSGYRLRRSQQPGRRTLKPELLLSQGVTTEQIEAATVVGDPSKPFLRADRIKGAE